MAGDIVPVLTNAIQLVSRLIAINQKIKNAEFSALLADLTLKLSRAEAETAGLLHENTTLKQRIRAIEGQDGEPCPKCSKCTWRVQSTKPDPLLRHMGINQRTYLCDACGFTEIKLTE